MAEFKFPDYKTFVFVFNPETGKYLRNIERVPFNKLPYQLKVEKTQEQKIRLNGANEIITGPIKGGKRLFFTGILPCDSSNEWYYGNDYEITLEGKKNSIVVFHFSNDNSKLTVYYFNNYYKYNQTERVKFIQDFVKHKGGN